MYKILLKETENMKVDLLKDNHIYKSNNDQGYITGKELHILYIAFPRETGLKDFTGLFVFRTSVISQDYVRYWQKVFYGNITTMQCSKE